MLSIQTSGSFDKTEAFLSKLSKSDRYKSLDEFGRAGVAALASATPIDSGVTSNSWSYEISKSNSGAAITWYNNHKVNGVPIAILIQYGHGTGTGGYVQGRDFINPALRPIFDKLAAEVWKAVTSA